MIGAGKIEAFKRYAKDYWEPSAGEAVMLLLAEREEMLAVLREVAPWLEADASLGMPPPELVARVAALLKEAP